MNGQSETPANDGGKNSANGDAAEAAVASDVKTENTTATPASEDTTALLLAQIKRLEDKITAVEKDNQQVARKGDASLLFGHLTAHVAAKNSLDGYLSKANQRDQIWDGHQAEVKDVSLNKLGPAEEFANKGAIEKYLDLEEFRMTNRHIDERYAYNRFAEYLKDYYGEAQPADDGQAGEDGKATEGEADADGPSGPFISTPSLSNVGWKDFQSRSSYTSRLTTPMGPFVIDVLEGEPILPQREFSFWGFGPKKATANQDDSAAGSKKPTEPGHAPLPERIRIHSSQIASVLEKITGADVTTSHKNALVMLRPFKVLTFYEDQLREHYAELEKKFSAENAKDGTPNAEKENASVEKDSSEKVTPSNKESASGDTQVEDATKAPDTIDEGGQQEGKESQDAQENAEQKEGEGAKQGENGEEKEEEKKEEEDRAASRLAFEHLRCLLDFIDGHIVAKQKYLKEPSCKVYFSDLWHVFKPGATIIESGNKFAQCYRVIHVRSPRHKAKEAYNWPQFRSKGQTEKPFTLFCVSVDYDGKTLGPVPKTIKIAPFEGSKDITTLPAYPLRSAKDQNLHKTLVERGQKFVRVAGVKHMHFSGYTLETRDEVDSQVVIDFAEAINADDFIRPKIDYTGDKEEEFKNEVEEDMCGGECCIPDRIYDDHYIDGKRNEQFIASLLPETDEEGSPLSLAIVPRALRKDRMHISDDDFVVMSYRVFGFVLRSKSWGTCLSLLLICQC